MELDSAVSLFITGAVFAMGITCVVSVVYVRWVDRQRAEASRYLDMLVHRDTRVGIAEADLLMFMVYLLLRSFYGDAIPKIGPGVASLWLGSAILLMGWGPVADALQFRRDRRIGTIDTVDQEHAA